MSASFGHFFITLLAACMGLAATCQAEDFKPLSLSSVGSVRTAWWTHSRSLDQHRDIATASVWINAGLDLNAGGSIKLDGWAGAQSRDNNQGEKNDRLRELYWRKYLGDADIRIGRQIIIWGRADGINPTDNLTPRDFTLLTPDDADQRLGVLAANVNYEIGEQTLQLVWQPDFEGDKIALPESPQINYRFFSPQRRGQWAIKLDRSAAGLDWSLSYLDGNNRVPDLSLAEVGINNIDIGLSHHRQQVWGADAATTLGPYIVRAEFARTDVSQSDDSEENFFRKRSQTQFIIGGERSFDNLTLNLQYFSQRVHGFHNAEELVNPVLVEIARQQAAISNQNERFQQGVTFRMAWNWANDTWLLETSGIYILDNGARFWRGNLDHWLDDRWRARLGFDSFAGPKYSIIGRVEDNSTVYAELRFGF